MLNNILAQRITSFKNKEYMNLKIPILGTFRSKIEILSTYNLLCQKFKAVCWKTLTFCHTPHGGTKKNITRETQQ